MSDPPGIVVEIDCETGEQTTRPMTPDEIAAAEAAQALGSTSQKGAAFESQEDAERLQLVAERAAADPAFAALAELSLRGVSR